MMLTTHALVGAALGKIFRNRPLAFLSGMASHAAGDVIPHREKPMSLDLPLAAATLFWIARCYGMNSPEFLGAIGGMCPDFEHAPTELLGRSDEEELFPTHGPYPQPWLHSMGVQPEDDYSQWGLALASILALMSD